MACSICRICYKKRRVLLAFLAAASFWMVYLLLILPEPSKLKNNKDIDQINGGESYKNSLQTQSVLRNNPVVNVEPVPGKNPVIKLDVLKPEAGGHISLNISFVSSNKSKPSPASAGRQGEGGLQIAKHIETFRNKTYDLGMKVKEQLANIGLLGRSEERGGHVRHIKRRTVFNLTMTHDEYLHIIKSLVVSLNQAASTTKSADRTGARRYGNRTSSRYGNSSCSCGDTMCTCCVRLEVSKLRLKNVVCANVTFLTKTQELFLVFALDRRSIYNGTISAQHPPTICVGLSSDWLEICSSFSNVTFRVNKHDAHKTQLNGCIDFSLAFFNRTLSSFPLGCFQIPDPLHRRHDVGNQINWVL